ncbi:MAG: acylphosphatase [Deltaproteobacteria bacterium]|nr:acylphosphatase [Deltaproteobacteria bacterium]MBI4373301.1 acylphosphatase [Deltaproteobacteria bacterium]
MEKVGAHLWISGRVQGVCYRAWTEEVANSLQLTGWVRNLPTGDVESLLEGEKSRVEEMIQKCRQGPTTARVKEVRVEWEPFQGRCPDFRVI